MVVAMSGHFAEMAQDYIREAATSPREEQRDAAVARWQRRNPRWPTYSPTTAEGSDSPTTTEGSDSDEWLAPETTPERDAREAAAERWEERRDAALTRWWEAGGIDAMVGAWAAAASRAAPRRPT